MWRQCSYATYFHSREWAEIWSRYEQGKLRPNPLLVMFTDGKKALLPLSYKMWESAGASGKYFESSANGNYGGWIAVDPLGTEHAILMKEFLTQELGYLFWQINPFDDLVAEIGVDATFHGETQAINLERGFDAVYAGWDSACRNRERKGRKSGILVRLAQTEEDWRGFYRAYEDSLRRWGDQAKKRYGWALFQEMFNRQSDHIKLWLATTTDELIVAGVLMCYARTHAVPWHGGILGSYAALQPNNRLFYETIKDACDKRYRWFDFGTSPSEGVRRFKQSFGARSLDYIYVDIR
ncbi:MAG: GNAT family N-acetyltransferase, partial [Armatimonadetes bacterium]|nr:GNAT family N-acetyltransferase [Armatimonadota bacterium]NIT32354.1 GNAT family N-acetyltransferase [Armatimonadota bacterium]